MLYCSPQHIIMLCVIENDSLHIHSKAASLFSERHILFKAEQNLKIMNQYMYYQQQCNSKHTPR